MQESTLINEQWHGSRANTASGDRCGESDEVIGALEYQSESGQLKNALQSLQNSLAKMAAAPLAQKQPQLITVFISAVMNYKTVFAGC